MHSGCRASCPEIIERTVRMFLFYFNKLGWLGSILVSIVLTLVLVVALRSCSG